jgi:hypothetical protein
MQESAFRMWCAAGVVAERGVALADLTGKGSDDVVLTNGDAGTVTILLSSRGRWLSVNPLVTTDLAGIPGALREK